uniref:Uncharacterized protein n=1 Tax=Fagus sylvatica TaxID=28930 RepID=A0A2N9FUA8_FAGSY
MVARLACTPPETAVCILPRFSCAYSFLTRFSRAVLEVFWNSKWVMQHIAGKLSTSSFQRFRIKRGMLSANREFHDVAWSRYLSNAPGLADQLVASRKDSAREGGSPDVGFRRSWYRRKACAAYFCKVPGFAEIRAWTCEIWPREQRPPGVFLVRLRAVFRSGFRLDPDKILAIREFHVMHECVFFPNVPGLADQLVASQEDSARKRGNVGGKIPELSAKPYFVGLFSRAWPCTEASLGSQDMILRMEAVGMFLMPRGSGQFDSAFGLVNSPGQTLVKLGQPWSNLVKTLQTLGNVSRTAFRGFLGQMDPSRAGNGSVKPRSNFGQPWSNLVNPGQTWSTLVKPWEMCPGPSSLGVFDATRLRWIMPAGSGSPHLACRHSRKSRG